ncbi:MAG: 8-oxo-dGTP diphosphatase [Candidatus Heimdallarchaeota archaeon]|nr:8-oxo-dGTP diphosphatase [Candidatus Heimdallarchaeota archaeon]
MITATLIFLRRDDEILLTYKKRGFAMGKWNGPGGKVEKGETIEENARREVCEEIGVELTKIEHVGNFNFYDDGTLAFNVHVFISWEYEGVPTESEEVRPQWYRISEIPYDLMWEDDKYWLPRVLNGEKLEGDFFFSEGLTKVQNFVIE